ncbi:HET-domain-containing protein [Teratosphaeria nubilosa]|uniref:HET-domain-containing protein n=1 Tax=Teratosphaeria nubilosa TaxID=161662 RepID=A0A6G1LMP8_9PEZI|nr:HET-domain-containing protein [Teratosphaeria nubilosa]
MDDNDDLDMFTSTPQAQRNDSHRPVEDTHTRSQASQFDDRRKVIKLCSILDGNRHDPLACSLRAVNLSQRPVYQCISYVWGDPNDQETMQLDGKSVPAPSSLVALLLRLRGSTAASDLWVDTLCIDQENHDEKKEQVALMGEIYANAENVIVWLGDTVPGEDHEGREEPEIQDAMTKLAEDAHFHDLPFIDNCRSRRCPSASGRGAGSCWTWPQTLALWMRWFDVSWFERAWTVQEILLARSAVLMLGSQTVSWEIVSRAWVNLGRHMRDCCTECIYNLRGRDSSHVHRMIDRIVDPAIFREKLERGQHLIDPLPHFSWKKSSYEIDKLYGFRGLQNGAQPTPVVPDYDISLQELYYRFARASISTQGWLVPLCSEPRHEKEGLPSWVPDWSLKPNGPALYRTERFQWSFTYNAAKGFPGFPQVDGRVLEVNGVRFDHIVWTSSVYTRIKQFSDRFELLRDWQDLVHPEDVASRPYPASGTRQEAFWRTMFADRYYYDEEKPSIVTAADIHDLQDFVSKTARDLVEFGADAVVGLNEAMTSHIIAVVERRLFITSKGYIGLCPAASKIGDEIFVLGSCPAPVVLRSTHADGGGAGHVSMGHCFVHMELCMERL